MNETETTQSRTSVLAIIAFVLAFLIGPIGSLLGIVAVIVVATSRGRLRGLGFGIAAIGVGFFFWGILAAIAIPAFVNYLQRAKTIEASLNVDRIYEGAVYYYEANRQLPQSTDWTPAVPCCGQAGGTGKCSAAANLNAWATPGWRALEFSLAEDFNYQYRFVTEGNTFRAQARGDLDCDSQPSLFERSGVITAAGTIDGAWEIEKQNPLE